MINDETDDKEKLIEEKRIKSEMYRYLTQELTEELLSLDDTQLGGEVMEVSTLFTDIQNYTAWTENLETEEVVALLNEYFDLMVEVIFKNKGTLDKYIGASMIAVFGSPFPLKNHAWCAVQTAIEMRHRLVESNAPRLAQNQIPICMNIGINSARVFSGNIVSSQRMEYTATGSGVDLASYLTFVTRLYGCDLIISDTTYRPCSEKIWARELGSVRFKGIKKPVSIYEVVGLHSEPISSRSQQLIEVHQKGREYYLNRQFRRAINEFATILDELNPKDKAAALHLERCCQYLSQEPPADDWDGAWTITQQEARLV
ncbi:adenylate/guanylate cyclase domain-containing protein [Microcoleus sp. ZQ-A2]|nr:adenylate/guanylate cyclase domain-containing protein [Microcoleus sp. FACHB-1]